MNLSQRALFETAFTAVNMGADHLERQCAINENDLAVAAVGDALGLKIKGFDSQPALGKGGGRRFVEGIVHALIVSGQRAGKYLDGSTGLPCFRTSK